VWGAHVAAPSPTTGSAITVSAPHVVVHGFDVTGGRVGITVTASDATVRANHVHAVFPAAPDANGAAGIDVYTDDYGPLSAVVIDGNVVDHVGRAPGASGRVQGIYIAVPCPGGRIVNNVVSAVEDYGIHAYHDPAYWTVANNTVVGNGRGILVGPRFTVVNNISTLNRGVGYAIATAATVSGPTTFAANLSFGNGDDAARPGVRVADPMFVRAAADGSGDYRLAAGSPGVDAGVADGAPILDFAGAPRPSGAGWDIGAFER
jgi:nitrous oxidase accessory protein NosD